MRDARARDAGRDMKAQVPHPSQHQRDGWDVSRRTVFRFAVALGLTIFKPIPVPAQQLIGYVSTKDADVTGASDVVDGHAVLSGSVAVTAKDHTAPITLGRGGMVRVCQTSVLHLTQSRSAQLAAPLLLSLDRGAIEIEMAATASDSVMTPDMRLAVNNAGPLDLRMRIARNGDTCVENRGLEAPTLNLSDPFGGASYQLLPNQHVLFEHGSLHEVVDHETIPCGCPDANSGSIADALLAGRSGAAPGAKAAPQPEAHPFPSAVSEGLAPTPEVPQAPPGQVHAQITDSLSYSAPTAAAAPAPSPPTIAATPNPTAQPPAEPKHGLFHAVGHFFRRLFGAN